MAVCRIRWKPSSAGAAGIGRGYPGRDQWPSGRAGSVAAPGHRRRCRHHSRAELDQDGTRDPEMHQTKKGNQYTLG